MEQLTSTSFTPVQPLKATVVSGDKPGVEQLTSTSFTPVQPLKATVVSGDKPGVEQLTSTSSSLRRHRSSSFTSSSELHTTLDRSQKAEKRYLGWFSKAFIPDALCSTNAVSACPNCLIASSCIFALKPADLSIDA